MSATTMHVCPKGHDSTDEDFCSVCGAKIAAAVSEEQSACPDCGVARPPAGETFCEICGYNFATGARGEETPSPPPNSGSAVPSAATQWELIVSVDEALRAPESPEPPAGFEPLIVRLKEKSNLIGRTSERKLIAPEITLDHDDAVSHRHAVLTLNENGTGLPALVLRDIGSSNGTALNGIPIAALADTSVNEGDVITLGHWTRIVVRAVSK